MKRDMDLVRKILFAIEAYASDEDEINIEIDGHTTDEINYHLIILMDAGLIRADYEPNVATEDYIWNSIRLTWEGHEFLDAARDNARWKKAKDTMMEKAGGYVLPVLMQLLTSYLKAELKLP